LTINNETDRKPYDLEHNLKNIVIGTIMSTASLFSAIYLLDCNKIELKPKVIITGAVLALGIYYGSKTAKNAFESVKSEFYKIPSEK
jgi:hypothetical protein